MIQGFVYLEGPSDQLGMRELLQSLIEAASEQGRCLLFFALTGKKLLLVKGPRRALHILRNQPESHVFLVPDLYPPNIAFPHKDYEALKIGLKSRFCAELERSSSDRRLEERFHVHCFKHDLETLVLASEESLLAVLRKRRFSQDWSRPVETQNDDKPPKRIVKALFDDAGMTYKETVDVPKVLAGSSLVDLMARCLENFAPFVTDLR